MRARTVVEHDLLQRDYEAAGIARFADFAQAIEPFQHVALRHAVAYENADLLMGRGRRVFEHRAQLFVELFSGTHTGEFNLDVLIRPQTGQQNQVSGKIYDLYRLAHIQDADLAALSDDGSL